MQEEMWVVAPVGNLTIWELWPGELVRQDDILDMLIMCSMPVPPVTCHTCCSDSSAVNASFLFITVLQEFELAISVVVGKGVPRKSIGTYATLIGSC